MNQVALATESRPPAAVKVMNEMNATEMLADLYMAVGNLDAAREMYAKMVAATPDNREDHYSAKGFLALRDGQKRSWQRSISGGRLMRVAGMPGCISNWPCCLRDTRRDEGSVEPLLKQATALNPSFAEAWYQLGLLQMRQSRWRRRWSRSARR